MNDTPPDVTAPAQDAEPEIESWESMWARGVDTRKHWPSTGYYSDFSQVPVRR